MGELPPRRAFEAGACAGAAAHTPPSHHHPPYAHATTPMRVTPVAGVSKFDALVLERGPRHCAKTLTRSAWRFVPAEATGE